jgi:hypothetical protein
MRRWAAVPMPWVIAIVAVLLGVGAWAYRIKAAGNPERADALVHEAWTTGRHVPLEGEQRIHVEGAREHLQARVLTSPQGFMRIEYLTPPLEGVTIWENGEQTYRYNPKAKRLTVAQKRTTHQEEDRLEAQLLQNYAAEIAGHERVAGIEATIVELRPRSKTDRRKRVWIDPNTKLVLRSDDLLHREGKDQLVRSTAFEKLRFLSGSAIPGPEQFRPPDELIRKYGTARPGDSSTRLDPARLSKLIGFPVRVPKWLPRGYTLEGGYQTPCECRLRHQAARLEFSDGLNKLTLFECGYPGCPTTSENCFAPDLGGRNPLAVARVEDGVSYLAIGDVPRGDLEHVIISTGK